MEVGGIPIPVRPGTPKACRRRPEVDDLEDIVDLGCENRLTHDVLHKIDVILQELDYPDIDEFVIGHMYSLHPAIFKRCLFCVRTPSRVVHAAMFKGRCDLVKLMLHETDKSIPRLVLRNDQIVDVILGCGDCSHFWHVFKLFAPRLSRADDVIPCLLKRGQELGSDEFEAALHLIGHRLRTFEAINLVLATRSNMYMRVMKSVWLLPQDELRRLEQVCDEKHYDELKPVVIAELRNRQAIMDHLRG